MIELKKMMMIILAAVFVGLIIVFPSIPDALSQITFGIPAEHDLLDITIGEKGEVHVVHKVKGSDKITQIDMIEGNVSNLKVTKVNGDDAQYGVIGGNAGVTIFSTNDDVLVEYDLGDALILENGKWGWDYFYPVSSKFIFPDSVDLIFVNDTPVNLVDKNAVRCHGCDSMIEYVIGEPIYVTEVPWEDKKFEVEIRTLAEINSFSFDQPSKSISFEVNDPNQFVTMTIPLELLWQPYQVELNGQIIAGHEFFIDESHVGLSFRPDSSGTITVIGITVIPEFPILVPLVLGIVMVIGLQFRNKRINLR